jgi:hypothetical protein
MGFTEFAQWCFKDENSGAASILVLVLLGYFVIRIIKVIKGGD